MTTDTPDSVRAKAAQFHLMVRLFGDPENADVRDMLTRYAESLERTCEWELVGDWWRASCSEDLRKYNGFSVKNFNYRFCMNCGARIVEVRE